MTTQDLINTLKQGKPMTDKLMREIVRELESVEIKDSIINRLLKRETELILKAQGLRYALEKIDAMQDGEFLNYDLAKKYARKGLEGEI
jgi:hypothetical protein